MDLRSRASLKTRSYEDIQPPFEWVQGEGIDTLRFDLSGFKKEQLKVRIDNYGNLTVSGERPLGGDGNSWGRFSKEFRVHENCNTKEIRAKFDNGILNVTMPKLGAPAESQVQPSKSQEAPAKEKPAAESKPTTTERQETSQKPTMAAAAAAAKKPEPVDAGKDKRKAEEKEEDNKGKAPAGDSKVTGDTKKREKLKSEVREREEKVSKVSADAKDTSAETGRAEDAAGKGVLGKSKYALGLKKLPGVLVVNAVVVAVIVIVGLGIYLTYKFVKNPEMDSN